MITVRYSCDMCGLEDVSVDVAERGEDQDIIAWMEGVAIKGTSLDHRNRSPMCRTRKLQRLMVPLPKGEDARLGETTKH